MTRQQVVRHVEFLDARQLHLVETRRPWVSPEELQAIDRIWGEEVARNPSLFDGPVVACMGLQWPEPQVLVLSWARATYRYRALRQLQGVSGWLPSSVYVTALLATEEGALAVGRGSPSTAAPGRWTLPGGSAEPPPDGQRLDVAVLRRHAARELAEEIGVRTAPEEMTLWGVTRGEQGNIGVHYLAKRLPAALVRERYARLVASEVERGVVPELDRLAFVRSAREAVGLGAYADYLPQLVDRYAASLSAH